MTRAYGEELVYASTKDGLVLAGIAIHPVGVPLRPLSVVWVHGNGGAFHDYPYVAIGRELAALGYPFLSGDTRGHDIAAFLWRPGQTMPATGGGAAWERLDESPLDLAAWADVAAGRGTRGLVLAGYSVGAQKVVLYQAERQDPRLAGIVLASPSLRAFSPPGALETARRLVAEGRGLETLPAHPYAPGYLQSAQNAVSAADVVPRLFFAENGDPLIASIRCPILAFCGALERDGAASLDTIRQQARSAARVDTQVIADVDHFLTPHEPAVAHAIGQWAATLD